MEVNLKREAIQYCTPVYSDTLSREETLETVVSDTLPDVARILDVDAAVYLRSKTLLQGSIRIEGSIRGTVLYIGEDSERLQRIDAELPVSFSAEAEVTEDTDILAANLGGRQAFEPAEDPVSRRGLCRGRGVSQRDGGAPDRGGADAGTLYADRHKDGQLSLRHRGEELSCIRRGRASRRMPADGKTALLFAYGDRGGAQAGRRKDDIAGNGSARYAVSDGRRRCAAAAELSHPILPDP